MQPLFAVPASSSETPPYYPYNAWSSLPLALPFVVDPTSTYGCVSGVLAGTSFTWWWFGSEQARIVDVACVGYFISYPLSVSQQHDILPPAVAATSVALGMARMDRPLQLVLVVSASGSLLVLAASGEYLILFSTLVALAFKILHIAGLQRMGTAVFHVIAGMVLLLIQTHNWEDAALPEASASVPLQP